MAEAQKDTVYIDIDDEITSIIDKVRQSKHKIVALVLPKRATVLQSIVNMKLLKRTSDETKKRIVLITSESGLLPLAGAVGLYVAKTLHSKPAIPDPPEVPSDDMAVDEAGQLEDEEPEEAPEVDKSKPVGELAGDKKAAAVAKPALDETIDLDNDLEDEEKPVKAAKKAGKKGDKKLKVPNFNSFRKRIFLIGGAFVLLLIFGYMALFVLPKATVTATTDNLTVTADIAFTASTSTSSFDEERGVVPATAKDVSKSDTEKVAATGKKNVGEKAGGTVTLSLTDCSKDQVSIPAGTGVSADGLTFITQDSLTLNSVKIGNQCRNSSFPNFSTGSVKVVAQNSGDQYNVSQRTYSVSGFGNVSASGTAMTGGTTKNITVVSQEDVDGVKQKLTEKSKAIAKEELTKAFQAEQLFALQETFAADETKFNSSPKVGDEASEVTVTAETKFTTLGVKREDLRKLVEKAAEGNIDSEKQAIANDGLDEAVFRLVDKGNGKQQKLSAQTQVTTGTQINEDDLKEQIKGKKRGDVEKALQSYPGVKEVDVKFSPFWVSKTPNKTSRITVVLEQTQTNGNNE